MQLLRAYLKPIEPGILDLKEVLPKLLVDGDKFLAEVPLKRFL